ncbi:NADH-quinone oxidoreductase subunit NuoG [Derxia lacustris]|uniref:NADH-quinone oxidoreductase subunit NuoG n=1 Tax=Derxia lacustris TaxID=764842 RepID=UPI000A173C78|nr:NADH-quinone oxidoreductase subunit NuoG [Derxia lacustris]
MSAVDGQGVEIEIDGAKVQVAPGAMVMEAASKAGVYVPHFCYHKKLTIAANCRMCLVEVEKSPKALPACATPVTPGMVVKTKSPKAIAAQKSVMEFLLINHPLDCPICDQGGECQLQDLAVGYGGSSSQYQEEKRVVFHKPLGPLISAEEMTRCIHCTRCVRFGQEIAGVMELGMANRGEHSEIMTFVGRSVDSELSGNMIDLCPVGALTSKPFRYSARTWELARRRSVAPHDSLGSNIVVQVKNGRVKRVVPYENEEINECWLSDRDRFSYEALDSDDRLLKPLIRKDGVWQEVEWDIAIAFAAEGLAGVKARNGAQSLGFLGAPTSTVEELHLLQKLARSFGAGFVETRLRVANVALGDARNGIPWLGMQIAEIALLDRALIIGSYLRKDHPLLAARIRGAAKQGLEVSAVHGLDEDWLLPIAEKLVASPSDWLRLLAGIARAISVQKGIECPAEFAEVTVSESSAAVASSLLSGEKKAVFLGNAAVQHPEALAITAAAQWIANQTGATLGVLTEGANSVGAYLVNALPDTGRSVAKLDEAALKALVLLNVEPELDSADGPAASAALKSAEFVVAIAPFKGSAVEYADVLLPMAPFTETSGSFVNAEGRLQSFAGVVHPLGDARPAWKILRVLANTLDLSGFEHSSSEAVLTEALGGIDIESKLDNSVTAKLVKPAASNALMLERLAPVGIYASDSIVRRAPSLQLTRDGRVPGAVANPALLARLGIAAGDRVRVRQGAGAVELIAAADSAIPENAILVAAGHSSTSGIGPMFGEVTLERM